MPAFRLKIPLMPPHLRAFRGAAACLLVAALSLSLMAAALMLTRTTGALEGQMREQQALSMANNVQTMSTAVDLWAESAQRVVSHWAQGSGAADGSGGAAEGAARTGTLARCGRTGTDTRAGRDLAGPGPGGWGFL